MEIYKGILTVSYPELTDSSTGDVVMSPSNYKQLCNRRLITVLRPGKGLGCPALIEWCSMPQRFKDRYINKYGDPEIAMRKIKNTLKMDEVARVWFEEYETEGGVRLKSEMVEQCTLNASVLNKLLNNLNTQKACRGAASNSTPINWDAIFAECERLRDEYGHTLPKNQARIREKVRQYKLDGYKCLISGKVGNTNTTKLTAEAQEWLIAQMRNRVHRNRVVDVFKMYNEQSEAMGWKRVRTEKTITDYLFRPDIRPLWEDSKVGDLAVRAQIQRQGSFDRTQLRDSQWFGDGTVINLYYKEFVGGKYVARRLWVYEVMDAATECFLGYDIAENESFEMMYRATLMALQTSGHKPYTYAYDNQTGSKQKHAELWLKKTANKTYHTAPYHGNSKTIESGFGRFQQQVLYRRFNYSGGNITAGSMVSKVDREFLEANVGNLPTRSEAIAAYVECRQQWNDMPMTGVRDAAMSRWQVYQSSENPNTSEITEAMMADIRMIFTQKAVKYAARGMHFTVKGVDYEYEVMKSDLRHSNQQFTTENVGREFCIEYDPDTLGLEGSFIKMYIDCGKSGRQFVTRAYRKITMPRDMMSQTKEQQSLLHEEINAGKKERVRLALERSRIETAWGTSPEQQGFKSPKIHGISDREFEMFADEIRRESVVVLAEDEEKETPKVVETDNFSEGIGALQKSISSADRLDDFLSRM